MPSGKEIAEASPYEGAKPALAIGDRFEDTEWISELPLPKRRKRKQ